MKKLSVILFASLIFISAIEAQAKSNNMSNSFHLQDEEMAAYMNELGFSTEVNVYKLKQVLPEFEILFNENNNEVVFNFENSFMANYSVEIFNMDGKSVDSRYFIQDGTVTVRKGHLPAGDYIYNLQGEDGHIYSGLISYK